jgi:hypothetical protein
MGRRGALLDGLGSSERLEMPAGLPNRGRVAIPFKSAPVRRPQEARKSGHGYLRTSARGCPSARPATPMQPGQ